MANVFTVEELLTGSSATHTVEVPAHILRPGEEETSGALEGSVILRPLLVRDVDRINRAAKEQRVLTSILMVQQSLVSPQLSIDQVSNLPAGLVRFLLEHINRISGLSIEEDDLEKTIRAPMTRACFALAKAFGWTPAECSELTVGQVLLYLEMLARDEWEES